MRYYVIADVHGFFTPTFNALEEKGFFDDPSGKLIICGDLFDRGGEAVKMQEFVLDLLEKDRVILIRGNHEDLYVDLYFNFRQYHRTGLLSTHHMHNGTLLTACQLTGKDLDYAQMNPDGFAREMTETPYVKTVMPKMIDYFETKNYVFVHGWIPPGEFDGKGNPTYNDSWRTASGAEWQSARWLNGMYYATLFTEPGKTIVCGHYHSSFGHHYYEKKGSEFGSDADFSPFSAPGILAIDGCTAFSGIVNCLVIEDDPV